MECREATCCEAKPVADQRSIAAVTTDSSCRWSSAFDVSRQFKEPLAVSENSFKRKSVDKLFSLRAELTPPSTDCSGNAGRAQAFPGPAVLKKPPPEAVELTDVIVGGPVGGDGFNP